MFPLDSRVRGDDVTINYAILREVMKPSLATKLTQLAARIEELDGLLAAPDVTRDLDRYRALSREYAEIAPVVGLHRDWQQAERDLAVARGLLGDPEMKAYAEDEAKVAKATMER